jgi:hypothetical protein
MSKGPGKWERAILLALEQCPAFYLMALLPLDATRTEVVALNRAARNLADKGLIASKWRDNSRRHFGARTGRKEGDDRGNVIVYRLGDPVPNDKEPKRCITPVLAS